MRHAGRIALVAIGSAIYAPLLVVAVIEMFGGRTLQMLFDWAMGRGCGGECRPVNNLITIAMIAVLAMTLPVLIGSGVIWIRRARRSDKDVKSVGAFMAQTHDWAPSVTSEIEPEVPRFYRDRQGRLRPMEGPAD